MVGDGGWCRGDEEWEGGDAEGGWELEGRGREVGGGC